MLALMAYDTHPEEETLLQSAAYAAALAIALILVFGFLLNWLFFMPKCVKPGIEQVLLKPCFGQPLEAGRFNPND